MPIAAYKSFSIHICCMDRQELAREVLGILADAGFDSYYCQSSPGCFDIAASKSKVVLVKILENIDAFTSLQAQSLSSVASMLGASCFVVGYKSKEYSLSDGTVYMRHGITTCSPGTFSQALEKGVAQAKKFRRTMAVVDFEALRSARVEKGLSIEGLAAKAGVSPDTVYRYEHSLTLASPQNIRRLEAALGLENLTAPTSIEPSRQAAQQRQSAGSNVFTFLGMLSVHVAGPVDMMCKVASAPKRGPNAGANTIIAEQDHDMRTLERRAKTLAGLSKVMLSYPCFFVGSSAKQSISGIPVVSRLELGKIRNSQQLLELIGSKTR